MKKYRFQIILIIILVLLLALWLIFRAVNKKADDGTGDDKAAVTTVTYEPGEADVNTLTKISVTVQSTDNKTTCDYTLEDGGMRWIWSGNKDLPLSNQSFYNAVSALTTLTSQRKVILDDYNTAEKFGFTKPTVSLTLTDGDGTRTYEIGNNNQYFDMYYFRCTALGDEIYLVAPTIVNYWVLLSEPLSIVQYDSLPTLTEKQIKKITFSHGDEIRRIIPTDNG